MRLLLFLFRHSHFRNYLTFKNSTIIIISFFFFSKFEEELTSVHAAHQSLMRSSERKESLERSARIRLQEINVGLRNQVDLLSTQLALRSSTPGSMSGSVSSTINSDHHPGGSIDWQAQVARRDALIAQLVSQSKWMKRYCQLRKNWGISRTADDVYCEKYKCYDHNESFCGYQIGSLTVP